MNRDAGKTVLAPHVMLPKAIEGRVLVEASIRQVSEVATTLVIEIKAMQHELDEAAASLARQEKQGRGHDWRARQREASRFRGRGR